LLRQAKLQASFSCVAGSRRHFVDNGLRSLAAGVIESLAQTRADIIGEAAWFSGWHFLFSIAPQTFLSVSKIPSYPLR